MTNFCSILTNKVFADNKISVHGGVAGPTSLSHIARDNTFTVRDSLFIGQSDNFHCTRDAVIPHHSTFYPGRRSPRAPGGESFRTKVS